MRIALSLRLSLIAALVVALSGCARDREAEIQARMDQFFFTGDAVFFSSNMTCTGAAFEAEATVLRPGVPAFGDVAGARRGYDLKGFVAMRRSGLSPADIADSLLMDGDGTVGREILRAAASVTHCFDGTPFGVSLRRAMTREGGILAYDGETKGLVMLDYETRQILYIGGSTW